MMKITENKLRFIYLLFLGFVLIFVLGSSVRYYDRLGFYEQKYELMNSGWQRILPDGSRKNLSASDDSVLVKNLIIERKLPEDVPFSLTSFYIRTVHQDIAIWIDEEMVYHFSYADIAPFDSKIPPIYWVRVPVSKDQLGKSIRIELQGKARSTESTLSDIYFGEDVSILCAILWKNALQIMSSFCLVFMGVGLWVKYILVDRKQGEELGTYYLGLCLFFIGLWMGCQIDARQLVFNNILLLWNLEYLSLIMIPIPALLFINKVERGGCQKEIFFLCHLIILCDLFIIASAGFGIFSFVELNYPIDFLILLTCFEIARTFFVIKKKDAALFKNLTWLVGAGSTIISFTCIELLSFFLNGYANQGRFLSIGTVIFAFQLIHAQGVEYEKVREEMNKLEISEKVQSEFFANMSHEIRTPINTVIGMNEMILRESHDDAVLSYAHDIQASGENLLSLVNDILDFSRIESGGIKLLPKPYELADLLHDLNSMVRFRAEWKGLKFSIIVDEDCPAFLFGDSFRIREVILNLLDNAVKYTEHGKVSLTVSWKEQDNTKSTDRDGANSDTLRESLDSYLLQDEALRTGEIKKLVLCFSVRDTGIGIKEADQKLIFQKFQRIPSLGQATVQGTGLGLPITNYFVGIMHGKIELKSHPGEGSCFSAYIPQLSLNTERIGNFEKRYAKHRAFGRDFNKGFVAKDARILVVDDNQLNLRLVQNLLKRTEVKVDLAYSGEECLEKLESKPYDIVYLDRMMPGIDGEETLKRIREKNIGNRYGRPIPVVAFSSDFLPGIRSEYMNAVFDAYLPKPVNGTELERTLYTLLPENLIKKRSYEEFFESEMKRHQISEEEGEGKVLDRETGLKYCMQDEEVYREILTAFKDSSEVKMQEIESAFADSDFAKYRLYVHGLKTTSLTVGAVRLSEDAKKMEHAARRIVEGVEKEEAMQYIRYNHKAFVRLFSKAVKEASEYVQ